MTTIDQLPPHDHELEEAVLGSILIDPDALFDVQGILKPEAFHNQSNRDVYEAILRLSQRREDVDTLTVLSELKRFDKLDLVGGEAYVVGLVSTVPTSLNAGTYARTIQSHHRRRVILQGISAMARLAYDLEMDIEEVEAKSQNIAAGFTSGTADAYTVTAYEAAQQVYQESENAMQGVFPERLEFPFAELEELQPERGDLLYLAGRPGMGKTSAEGQIALHFAKRGKRVMLFSLEMSAVQIQRRVTAIDAGINYNLLKGDKRTAELTDAQWHEYGKSVQKMQGLDITYNHKGGMTIEEIESIVARDVMLNGDNLVVMIDHIQIMNARGFGQENENALFTHISKKLKAIAKNNNIWVICASQLSRKCEDRKDKRPMLSDLRSSGSLEQDADAIILMYRDEYYNPDSTDTPGIAEFNIAKHRNGPTGVARLGWAAERMMFHDLR